MKMEVETRVSVQAMRGKFEQKQEDPSGFCTPSPPALKHSPSPTRTRASSLIIKDRSSSCDHFLSCERITNSKDDESKCPSRNTKHSSNSVSKTKSIFSDIVSPMLVGSKVTKALSPKKHSVDSAKTRKIGSEKHEVTGNSATGTPSRKISENFSSETKPSVVRRIPVFKAFNGGTCPDDKVGIKKESTEPAGETSSRREKFLGHIRSRSHGNFMVKRDSSVERNGNIPSDSGGSISTSANGKKDFLSKKSKQKSSDNLFGHRDSKCASPFEGKQKLVSNVVKNMKNKEKPKVLRKFSFSSKIEKEIKNKKEKASPNKAKEVKVSKPSQSLVPCIAKMEAIAKSTTNERRSSITGSSVVTGTVSVAKAVADIALVKNLARSPEPTSNATGSSEETSPPSRPPRRRSTTSGLLSHKKGMAPSPPGPLLPQSLNKPRTTSPQSHAEDMVPVTLLEQGLYLDVEKRKQGSQCTIKSSDSFSPPPSSEVSRENSPVTISQKTPLLQRRKSKSSNNVQDADKLLSEGYCSCDEEIDGLARLITHKNTEVEPVQVDIELLPKGPPPKKPPRTFAYDIYRSSKEDITLKEKSETNETTEITSPPAGPIYAIPMKKKKAENRLVTKPPVRSNSDLSKRDLIKPSVAPKPQHILKKKRLSVVDPLSCAEKGEDAAMTSEFQRQAHIRYSLRRPKKPPPAPPPNSESEEGALNNSATDSPASKGHPKSCSSSNQSFHTSNNEHESGSNPQLLIDRCSPTDSLDMTINSRCTPDSIYQSVISDDTDEGDKSTPSFMITRSSYNLHVPTPYDGNQPLSLGYCPTDSSSPELTGLYRKRSMSDETLYKGHKYGDEPIYAMPIFANNKGSRGHNRQRELHYMCSVLFTDEEADAGRDGGGSSRRNSGDGETPDGNKVKPSIISAWKREFRQSCRQVQNKLKKSVNR